MIKYQNLTYENGTIYQGLTTKRVLKPNEKGLYKTKHQGEVFYHTIEELTGEKEQKKPKKTHTKASKDKLSKYCTDNGTSIGAYRAYLNDEFNLTIDDLSLGQNYIKIADWRSGMKPDEQFKIKELCGELGVCQKSYSTWAARNFKKPLWMSKDENIEHIKFYKSLKEAPSICYTSKLKELNIKFIDFDRWLTKKGLNENATNIGKLKLIDLYINQQKKRN